MLVRLNRLYAKLGFILSEHFTKLSIKQSIYKLTLQHYWGICYIHVDRSFTIANLKINSLKSKSATL